MCFIKVNGIKSENKWSPIVNGLELIAYFEQESNLPEIVTITLGM